MAKYPAAVVRLAMRPSPPSAMLAFVAPDFAVPGAVPIRLAKAFIQPWWKKTLFMLICVSSLSETMFEAVIALMQFSVARKSEEVRISRHSLQR